MKSAPTHREVSPETSSKRQRTEDDTDDSSDSVAKEPIGSDVITLDVGGEKLVRTLRSTLTVAPGSKLADLFGGRWDETLPKSSDGHFFIDYKPDIFLPLLDYLRSLSSLPAPAPSPPPVPPATPSFGDAPDGTALRFRIMVDAFELTDVLYNYELYQLKPDRPFFGADRATPVSRGGGVSVREFVMTSDRGAAFVLDRPATTTGDCHNRRVQAFEVRFMRNAGIKVGWTRRDLYRMQPINGIGRSISIDSRLALPGQQHFHDAAVVRCAKDLPTGVLTWSVDGRELVSTSHNLTDGANKVDEVVYVASGIPPEAELIPLVVLARGSECRISAVELEP